MPFCPSTLLSFDDPNASRRLRWQVAAAFVATTAAAYVLIDGLEMARVEARRSEARVLLQTSAQVLGQQLGQALSAPHAIAALIRQGRGNAAGFEREAARMLPFYPGVGALQLAPDGVVRQSVPLDGNEKAIGHDLFKDPSRENDAVRARDTRQMTLAGPFELIQGGIGAVARLPVFLPGTPGDERFWGFASALIRIPDLINSAGIHRLRETGLHYVLWRTLPDSGRRQVIAHSGPETLDDAISEPVPVANGVWILSAAPAGGWRADRPTLLTLALATLCGALIAALTATLLRHPLHLVEEVRRRTEALRDSEARLQSMFEQAPVAISVCSDADGYASTRWNHAWLAQFGYDAAFAQGRSGEEVGFWARPEERQRYLETVTANGEVHRMPARLRRADGEERYGLVSGRFVFSGQHKMLLTHYDDVTVETLAKEEIRQLNATLEASVAKRTQALRESNAGLWRAVTTLERTQNDLVRSEKMASLATLVAGVAHELNTPIGNGVTMATTLWARLKDFRRDLENGLRRSTLDKFVNDLDLGLDVLQKNLLRAGELVSSFKQVAVDQASQVRRQFMLDAVVGEIITSLCPSLKRTAIEVNLDVPAGIFLDSYPGPFGQVLVNLINNAVLHGFEPGSPGTVRIVAERLQAADSDEPNPWIRITVEDNGQGIPESVLPRIFDPFFTTKLGAGGSGLGLNISYNIVTALLGGRIEALSTVGQGTRILIDLPVIAPTAE